MINDTSAPTGKPYKRFLKLLRQIDQDWQKDNPEDADSDSSSGSAGGRSTGGTNKGKDTNISAHEPAG
jgi:hypothetical protein